MISKLLFIPRAAADIIKVLLHKNIPFSERWNIAKVLGEIKIASLSKKLNEPFDSLLTSERIKKLEY